MQNLTLNKDINLICIQAISFPDGIEQAFEKLNQAHPSIPNRTLFGISHGSQQGILYWAAAEAKSEHEGNLLGLESYTIKKGTYLTKTLKHSKGNEHTIGHAFEELLKHPRLDQSGECIEWYKNENEVICMVRIII